MKEQKGITLIALIITIIVMLILVGVSVTVALNGGLFSTAKQATDKTAVELDKEQLLELALGAIKDNGQVDLDKLDDAILADGKFEGTNGIYTSKKTGTTYKVNEIGSIEIVPESGTGTGPTAEFQAITASNYGDTIEYSAGNVSDWKVFYKDNDYLFIMTSDVISNTNLPDIFSNRLTKSGQYDVSWYNYDYSGSWSDEEQWCFVSTNAKTDISAATAEKFQFNFLSKMTDARAVKSDARTAADLLNVTAWTSKFGNASKGIEAIGSPTFEMWANSWNQKGEIDGLTKYPKYNFTCDSNGYSGYSVLGNEYPDSVYYPGSNNKFFIVGTQIEDSFFFNYGQGDIECIVSDFYAGLRPVVAIPSNLVTTNADGEWAVK